MDRQKVRFRSGSTDCAAWLYPGANGACVVMAGGFAVTKEPGTDRFAEAFHRAGFTVLAFDYQNLGESGGEPRLVLRIADALGDWRAAVEFAATLPDIAPDRIAAWGFSVSGGHLLSLAASSDFAVRAVIAQSPNADGLAATRNAARFQKPSAMLRLTGRGILDALGGLIGRPPRLVPLAGAPGAVALLTTPDGQQGDAVLNPGNRYPEWRQAAAARSALRLGFYRPGRHAARIRCPLLVVACNQDQSALAAPAVRAAERAPHGELFTLDGGHYETFIDGHERTVAVELAFLERHLAATQ